MIDHLLRMAVVYVTQETKISYINLANGIMTDNKVVLAEIGHQPTAITGYVCSDTSSYCDATTT